MNLAFAGFGVWIVLRGSQIEIWANQAGLEQLFQNGKMGYFCWGRGPNQIERWAAEGQASCCGVNLAFAGFSVWIFSGSQNRDPGQPDISQAKSKTNARSIRFAQDDSVKTKSKANAGSARFARDDSFGPGFGGED